jgi:hypothetical protein
MSRARASAARAWIDARLGARDVAEVLYGTIVGLALVIALQEHPEPPGTVAALIAGTAVAVALAKLYTDALSAAARAHEPLGRGPRREIGGRALAVLVGAGFPAVYFAAAAAGLISEHLAFQLSKWSGAILVSAYGYLAARLAGYAIARSILGAVAVGAIGAALILFKAALH